jgi:hypothetical protein
MAGMLGRDEPYTNSALCGKFSVEFADALLKAMEDDIKHGNQGTVDALREKLAALRRVMGGS